MKYHQQEVSRVNCQELSAQMSPTTEERYNSRTEVVVETEMDFKCNYCANVFSQGGNLEKHRIKNHKLPENYISCYGCDEEINDDLAVGQFVVLWDKGKVREKEKSTLNVRCA